jgi:hypothetical protein
MNPKEVKLSTRQMLLDIGSMAHHAKYLLESDKAYNPLLKLLIDMNYYYDEDVSLPTVKGLSEELNLNYGKVRKQIRLIYEDLLCLNSDEDFPVFGVKEISYSFSLSGRGKDQHMYFKLKSLPELPRVGEDVEIPFFKEWLDERHFFVESIEHEFTDQGQVMHFILKPGYFSPYWHYRKDKAREEQELGWKDFIDLNDWELKRKLRIGRR